MFDRLQQGLVNFYNWCRIDSMALNVSKSKCLIIGTRTKLQRIDYDQKLRVRNMALD